MTGHGGAASSVSGMGYRVYCIFHDLLDRFGQCGGWLISFDGLNW